MNDLWKNDSVQFPRLLAELVAVGAPTEEQMQELCESMDLEPEQVNELLDRAQARWEELKNMNCPPRPRAGECDGCNFKGIDGGPGSVMVCNHPKADDMGYIIHWDEDKKHTISDRCPLKWEDG